MRVGKRITKRGASYSDGFHRRIGKFIEISSPYMFTSLVLSLSMWTRRGVASSGPEKIGLLLRSSHVGRYLQVRQSPVQAALGSPLHCLQELLESDATYQVVHQNSRESHLEQQFTSAATSGKHSPTRLKDIFLNAESISPSCSGSIFYSPRPGVFPRYHHVREHGKLFASSRSVSYACLEDEDLRDATQGEHTASRDAGSSESWHTKLSVILAADALSAVSAVDSPGRIRTTVAEGDRGPSGDTNINLRSRPTPFSVCQQLRSEKDIEVAWRYFKWVGVQEGYKHSGDTYNTMIQSFCGAKKFSTIFLLLETMRQHGFYLTYSTCVKIMKSLASERMYGKALGFFKDVEIYGCKPNVVVYNAYLDILVKAGHYDRVQATFANMAQVGISPDVYTYNIVINGFRKADQLEKVLQVYEEMKQKSCPPNVVTYNTVLHALGQAGRTDEVLELFCEMAEKDMVPSAFTYSTLLHFFRSSSKSNSMIEKPRSCSMRTNTEISRNGANVYRNVVWTLCMQHDIGAALRSLREMESQGHIISLATYNLFAVFLKDAGKTDAVLELFRDMKAKNCIPDALTYRAAVEAACRSQKAGEALLLHKEMVGKGHAVAVGTWNMLIDAASKSGQVDTAFELFSEMQQTCKPDKYTYNTVISILCNLGKSADALTCLRKAGITSKFITSGEQGAFELFWQMKGVTAPDAVTYHTLIHALCRSGRVQECQDLLLEMEQNGLDPGVLLYNRVLNLLGQAGNLSTAWKLFCKMQSKDLPDLITYSTLINYLAKARSFGKATKLLDDLESKGFVPNIVTYSTLVDGLAKAKRFVEADKLMNQMAKRGCRPDAYAYNSLVDGYCKAGQVAKAYRVFEESIDKGCLPTSYTYTSLISGYFRSGNTNDALDMYNVMKGMGCQPTGVTFNILLEGLCKAGRIDDLEIILEEIRQLGVASTGVSTTCFDKASTLTRRDAEKVLRLQ